MLFRRLFCCCFPHRQPHDDVANFVLHSTLPLPLYNESGSTHTSFTSAQINTAQRSQYRTVKSIAHNTSTLHSIGTWNIGDRAKSEHSSVFVEIIDKFISARPVDVLFLQESFGIKRLSRMLSPHFDPKLKVIDGVEKKIVGKTNSVILLGDFFEINNRYDLNSAYFKSIIQKNPDLSFISQETLSILLHRSLIIEVSCGEFNFILFNYHGIHRGLTKFGKMDQVISLLKLVDCWSQQVNIPIILGGDFNFELLSPINKEQYNYLKQTFSFIIPFDQFPTEFIDLLGLSNICFPLTNDDYGRSQPIDFLFSFSSNQKCRIAESKRLRWCDSVESLQILNESILNTVNNSDFDQNILNHPYLSGLIIHG
ncbi:hypothetical protein P9112_002755 [Eukaryota sp. TZLM1-RC]